MRTNSRVGLCLVGSLLLLGSLAGCNSPGGARPIRASSWKDSGAAERAAKDQSVILWSSPITYHGVEVRFELPPGTASSGARFDQTEFGDHIVAQDLELSYRYQRFETEGGGRPHFEQNSRVLIFRPPSIEEPWTTVGDSFSFSWLGNGVTPVVREDRRDGTIIWTFRRTELILDVNRRLTYRNRDEEQQFQLPVTLVLGKSGEILEKRAQPR